MNKLYQFIFILTMILTLTSCTKYVYVDKYQKIYIDNQYIQKEQKPAKRVWTTQNKQGADVGQYIIDLNKIIDDANARFEIIGKYVEDYNKKVDELNDTAKKK